MAGQKNLSTLDASGQKVVNVADGTASTDAVTKGQLDTGSTNDRSRANHTGTQTASTISDFNTAVRTNRLDQMTAPTAPVAVGSQRLTSVADPTAAQDAATKNYVDAQMSAQAAGLVLKGSVRAATDTNVNIASPGTQIDSLNFAAGEIAWLRNQSTGSQNGPWVFNGSAAAMSRPTNFDNDAEAVLGSFWDIREGTYADAFILMTNDTAVTLGTTTLTSVVRGGNTVTGYTTVCPAVAGGGSWVVTHNMNSRAITPMVARVGSPYDIVGVRIERTSLNTVTVLPDLPMAAGEYEIIIPPKAA